MSEQGAPPAASPPVRLADVGERGIVDDVVFARLLRSRYRSEHIGDDAGMYGGAAPGEVPLITIDPCPTPLVFDLVDQDYWHYGRMTAVIGLSDIAAMGGRPHGMVVATIMDPAMLVSDYTRFLDGLCEACDEWETPILGGNVREGGDFQVTCTTVGAADRDRVLRRTTAQPGDSICVIGDMGAFWSGILAVTHLGQTIDSLDDTLRRALLRPRPKLREGALLAESGMVTACMDASDGIGGCLSTLASANNAKAVFDPTRMRLPSAVADVADALSIDPLKLILSWGNWELVFTTASRDLPGLERFLAERGVSFQQIGHLAHGTDVWLQQDQDLKPLTYFGSDRFTPESYMTVGALNHADWLLKAPLTRSTSP